MKIPPQKKRKVISFLLSELGMGGVEKVAAQTANYLSKNYQVEVYLLDEIIEQDLDDNIRVVSFSNKHSRYPYFRKIWGVILLSWKYSKFLKNNQSSYSISFLNRPNFINVLASMFNRNCKVILNERSYPPNAYKRVTLTNKLVLAFIRLLYPYAHQIICNSELSASYFRNSFGTEKDIAIDVWRNPLRLENKLEQKVSPRQNLRMLNVGRLDDNKNQMMILKALALINNPDICLDIYGRGPNLNLLKEFSVLNNIDQQVNFVGERKLNPDNYKDYDVFILSSKFEGLPNVLLEAMNSGVPVISADCKSGPREILGIPYSKKIQQIEHNENGILIEPENEVQLAKAIQFYLNNPDYYFSVRQRAFSNLRIFESQQQFATFEELVIG